MTFSDDLFLIDQSYADSNQFFYFKCHCKVFRYHPKKYRRIHIIRIVVASLNFGHRRNRPWPSVNQFSPQHSRFGDMYTPWSMKEGCDKNDMNTVTHRCGTRYQGYLEFRHPTVSEGYVERIVCYQDATVPCECQFNSIIGKLLYAERFASLDRQKYRTFL